MSNDNGYTVRNGIIQNFGKFEGEPLSTPYFYDMMLNGEGDVIELQKSDYELFDNIPVNKTHAFVIVSEQGFVSVDFVNEDELEQFESNSYL
jgi:hypothetical protein